MSEKAISLAGFANPFDFANPVSKKDLFVGREKEQKDIKYYLDHAKNAERSINLAILGERAAGKTSLLNMIEIEADERGLIPVRIDLNEGDIEFPLSFWFKIFDSVFSEITLRSKAENGGKYFGGQSGKTFEVYLDLISCYDVPDDKTFCPFIFPIQYAKAMKSGNESARVSDNFLKRDFANLAAEADVAIVLIIDECNVLSANRGLLEMVRNTFMNLPGFMLVFTGTPDLFPMMDEVFSPIVRQFKKIEISPFSKEIETLKCVKAPLERVGLADVFQSPDDRLLSYFENFPPEAQIGMEPYATLRDLHYLTGGRPYEINLVCHFMFKRAQSDGKHRLALDYSVIEDVLDALRQAQDVDSRPIISAVRSLDEEGMNALRSFLRSAGKTPVEQLFFYYNTVRSKECDHCAMEASLEKLCTMGILSSKNGTALFVGDDFDRIVSKYAARKRNIKLSFERATSEELFGFKVMGIFQPRGSNPQDENYSPWASLFRGHSFWDKEFDDRFPSWHEFDATIHVHQLLEKCPKVSSDLFPNLGRIWIEGGESMTMARVEITGFGMELVCYFSHKGGSYDFETALPKLFELKSNVIKAGGNFQLETKIVCFDSSGSHLEIIRKTKDEDLMKSCVTFYSAEMASAYLEDKNIASALVFAEIAARFTGEVDSDRFNNIGYILLVGKKTDLARKVLSDAVLAYPDNSLPKYNLGILNLLSGNLDEAKKLFISVEKLEEENPQKDEYAALLVPRTNDVGFEIVEKFAEDDDSLDLLEETQAALQLIIAL